MFWRKDKKYEKPIGVQLSIELNAMTLGDVAKTSEPPNIERMSNVWLEYNCTKICTGVAAINGVKGSVLVISGSDGHIYIDMEFDIKLPFPISPNKTETIQVTSTANLIYLSFEEVVIMAFPTSYIVDSLVGVPLAEYSNATKELSGEQSEIEIVVISPEGDYCRQ